MRLFDSGGGLILVTGAAGFIGANLCRNLLEMGCNVIGVDNLTDYYDVALKHHRLAALHHYPHFQLKQIDLANQASVRGLFEDNDFKLVIHLAAQAGVRYSLQNPNAYIESNILGFQNILEGCRSNRPEHLVFASSSSVYGNSEKTSFSETDNTDNPVSLYAATKKSNEVIGHSYAKLFDLPMTGLRFFTVYGPAGRPDMAYFDFTRAILAGESIRIYNHGNVIRDFTYIDDIISGVLALCETPPTDLTTPFRVLNLGSNRPVKVDYLIQTLELLLGLEAVKEYVSMQPGDVYRTSANIDAARVLVGFNPTTGIEDGLERFVAWYRAYFE
ncbi:MAG: NAD-dependent epimerase/dehydratase family protein [Pseudomonadota bacterium]|nr:NAD-dependent epimerase/dehydratase family protein [Pseudomonadota bacterium]